MRDLAIVKNNVAKMAAQNAPMEDIDGYIASEGYTVDDIKNFKPSSTRMSRGEALGRSALQGGTFGFADELAAGGAALGAKLLGGKATEDISLRDLYQEARGTEREKLKQVKEQYPTQSLLAEIGGSIPTGAAALKGLGLAGTGIKTAIKGGAALGGLSAAGSSDAETLGELGQDVGLGTAVGGAIGGIAGTAIEGAKRLPIVSDMVKRLFKQPSGEDILGKVVKPEEAGKLATKLSAKEGRQTLLPDIAGDEVAGLTRLLGKTSGSKNIINQALNNRTVGSSKRVANLINNKISSDAYFGSLDDLVKARAEISAPLYKEAYQKGASIKSPEVKELLQDDRVISALKTSQRDFGINAPLNSVESLHGARQVIDDVIGTAKRAGENNKARAYLELKSKINNVLYNASPTLKQADNTFAGFSSLKNAQEEGLDFNRYRPEELSKFVSRLNPSEKDAFKIGVRENLMKTLENTPEGASAARRIFSKPETRQKLKSVFDNQKEYADFSRKMIDEIRIFDSKNRILGGSRTDINLADEGQIINKVAQGAVNPKLATLGLVTDSIKKRYIGLNEDNAKELARILISKEKSIDALRKIAAKADKGQQEIIKQSMTDLIPTITGMTAAQQVTEE